MFEVKQTPWNLRHHVVLLCWVLSGLCSVRGRSINNNDLVLVNIVFRHGDRTPLENFPISSFYNYTWPQGLGQLTKRGMEQQYKLGQYFRNRYIQGNPYSLLNPSYQNKEVYVQSSDKDRTLMSAECNMAGLFPPEGDQIWNDDILWQPIPVHTVPISIDNLIHITSSCPLYEKALQTYLLGADVQTYEKNNEAFYHYLEENTGLPQVNFTTAGLIYDTLFCEQQHDFVSPSWVNSTIFNKLRDAAVKFFDTLGATPLLSRLKGGPLLGDIMTRMKMKVHGSIHPPQRKMFLYSAHDSTLAALLSAMKVYDGALPQYAASLMVELHYTSGNYIVQIWYRNNITKDPQLLVLPGCSGDCPLDKFISITKDTIPTDWNAECHLPE